MAVTAAQNDCYQVRVQGRIDGQLTENVLHFKCASGAGDSDVELHLIVVLVTCFIDNLIPVITSGWTLERVVWKRVTPTLGVDHIYVPLADNVGAGNAAALPSFNSMVLSIRTDTGGKSHRGRMYLPGIPEDQTVNSTIDPSSDLWAGLLGFAACLVTNFIPGDPVGSNSWSMQVYSRKIGGATFPYGAGGFTPMSAVNPVSFIGTTRSRKVGRGA